MNKKNIITAVIGLAVIAAISSLTFWLVQSDKQISYQSIKVQKGDLTKEIKATGTVKPAQEIEMSWEKSGRVTKVNVKVGDQVKAGDVLMSIDSADLGAQLSQAQANLLSAQAVYDQLKNGARPEEIEIKKMELEKAQQDLASAYDNIINTLNDAYAKTDEAVRKNTDDFFTLDNTDYPQLSFLTTNSQLEINIETERALVEKSLIAWQQEMTSLATSKNQEQISAQIAKTKVYLSDVRTYLNEAADVANTAVNLNATNIALYKTSANMGRTSVNVAISTLNIQEQLINTQKLTVSRVQKELDLKLAGTRSEDLQAQAARVAQAQASVDLINVQLGKNVLRAPIAGTITKAEAKVGEISLPNVPAVALISNGQFEIELRLSEADIATIKLGDVAVIKLDAFNDKSYKASVIAIDPAESTATDGSNSYKVRLQLSENYPEIKSGMTANISISIAKKTGVLTLPQASLIRHQDNYFILNKNKQEQSIQIGLFGSNDQVEIISGLSEGDEVLSLGR